MNKVLSVICFLLMCSCGESNRVLLQQTDLFINGKDGIAFYRIPALVTSNKGTLIAVCDARVERVNDAPNNIDLAMKRSFDNGKTWSPLQIIKDYPGQEAAGDPCMLVDRQTGTIWVFFDYIIPVEGFDVAQAAHFKKASDFNGIRKIWLYAMKSDDDGETWSEPIDLTPVLKNPEWDYIAAAPGIGIQANNGRLLVPVYSKQSNGETNSCHIIYSDDHGKTWNMGGKVGEYNVEPQVVELIDGSLMMNMRQMKRKGHRMISISKDMGQTWQDIVDETALPEPGAGCQASFIRYTDKNDGYLKNRLLFSNPASTEGRLNMTVRVSFDEGKTWTYSKTLHKGPSAYSCMTLLPDGSIGILYERGENSTRNLITFARFTLEWLTNGKDRLIR
ncbi:exo-alpha-sialidase [bacterium]|nr:exo-alpha-sialidase [bacterium]